MPVPALKLDWSTRLGQALLRAVWFGVIPALLAGLWLRHAVPPASGGEGPFARLLDVADRYPVPTYVLTFLAFAALLRHWRFYLPWGYCLARMAPEQAAALSRVELYRADEAPSGKPKRAWLEALSFVALLVAAAGAALLLRNVVFQSYSVLSNSMLPSFEKGDEVSVNRRAFASTTPARGEVVVFHHTATQDVIKRVLGLPGDEITMRGGFPSINGWEVPHCDVGRYVYSKGDLRADGRVVMEYLGSATYLTLHVPPARLFESYLVKPGEVFVLGDNRNQSVDSRNWKDGEPSGLDSTKLVGRVERYVLSRQRSGALDPASLLAPLGLQLNADGLDSTELVAGLERCAKARPQNTEPPPASAATQVSRVGAHP
jgi:signal peptidase I